MTTILFARKPSEAPHRGDENLRLKRREKLEGEPMLVFPGYYVDAQGYYVELVTRPGSIHQGAKWGI